jgi:hypothetical protein
MLPKKKGTSSAGSCCRWQQKNEAGLDKNIKSKGSEGSKSRRAKTIWNRTVVGLESKEKQELPRADDKAAEVLDDRRKSELGAGKHTSIPERLLTAHGTLEENPQDTSQMRVGE